MTAYEREKIASLIKAMRPSEQEIVVQELPRSLLEAELDRREKDAKQKMSRVDDICKTLTPEHGCDAYESAIKTIQRILE